MFKKLLLAVAAMLAAMGFALAAVDVNTGDQAALDGVNGIGPAKSKAIIAERNKNGNFKDWADFQKRVKGIGEKNSLAMSEAGLTVNGQPKPGAAAPAPAKPAKSGVPEPASVSASASASASAAAKASASASKSK